MRDLSRSSHLRSGRGGRCFLPGRDDHGDDDDSRLPRRKLRRRLDRVAARWRARGRRRRAQLAPAAVRRFFASFRVRLLVGYVGLLAVATLLAVVIANEALERRLDQRIDEALVQESRELRQLASGIDPETGEPLRRRRRADLRGLLRANVPSRNEVFLTFVDGELFLRSSQVTPYRLDQDAELVSRWSDAARRAIAVTSRRRPGRWSTSPSPRRAGRSPRRLRGGDLPRP